ncbi:MAG: Type and secretion system protein [Pedosphaera sp.]|nr:Type and secretion system protein [Pedosphaera sp.]
MKTTLLTLFLTCCGLCAQTPPAGNSDADARDAALRQAVRDTFAAQTNAEVAAPAQAAAPVVPPAAAPASPAPATKLSPAEIARRVAARRTPVPGVSTNPPVGSVPTVAENPLAALIATNAVAPVVQPVAAPAQVVPTPVPATVPTPVPGAGAAPFQAGTPPAFQAVPTPPVAAPIKPSEQIIPPGEINFSGVDINQVLAIYAQLVGRTVLHAALPPTVINLKSQTPLTTTEAIQAFDSILAMNGVTMINIGDKFVKAVPMAQAGTVGAPFNSRSDVDLPEADQYITDIVQLKYAKPSEMMQVILPLAQIPNSIIPVESSQMLIIRDYSSNVKRMLELVKQVDVMAPLDFDSEVIPIKYAQAQDIASALSSLGGGGGTSIGSSSRTGGTGAGGSGFGGAGGFGGSRTGLGTPGGTGSTFPGSTGYGSTPGVNTGTLGSSGAGRTTSFTDRLKGLGSSGKGGNGEIQILGQTKIIADQRSNSLLVFANKEDMRMIKKIIKDLDFVLPQVLIEAIIMEVSLDHGHNLGLSYLQTSPSTPGNYFQGIGAIQNGTFLNQKNFTGSSSNGVPSLPGGFSYAASFGNDFQATLTAIANDSSINVLSRPRIQTSHGVAANLQVGQQVPMVSGTYFGGINGQASSQYQQQFVGISLQVTPLINPDGLVVMDITGNVQQLGPNYTIDGNQVPSTTQRSAQATVSVRDRDTIILGGMISTSKNVTKSGVPLLMDIPGLGYLFRSTVVDNQRVELIILIRPTVLPTPEAAALVATRERGRMPGIKAAEAEEQLDVNKRLKEAEKIKVPAERP